MKLVMDELERAMDAHGSMSSCHEGYAVILEEMDELWLEIKSNNGSTHRGLSEAVQVAAMAVRFIVDLCEDSAAIEHERKIVAHMRRDAGGYARSTGGYSG